MCTWEFKATNIENRTSSKMRGGFHENSKIETYTKLHSIDQLTSSCENKNI